MSFTDFVVRGGEKPAGKRLCSRLYAQTGCSVKVPRHLDWIL